MRNLIIVSLISVFFCACGDNNELMNLVNDPIDGDLYEVKLDENQYTIYWVTSVERDTIIFRRQLKTVQSKAELKELVQEDVDNIYHDKRGIYDLNFFSLPKSQLIEDAKAGKIIHINRMSKFRKAKQ